MQLAKVIGSVVATRKDELLTGIKLLVIQPVDSKGNKEGSPIVAVDTVGAGSGEMVIYAKSKEGAMALPNPSACADAGITGIIDHVYRP
ncbi:EutN/CcmL family microcompartment protein [Candidatus Clostridium stratigraminis]|jgi:ethanolamine utilization protein EutN|uniref:EutN/CcmL family microcompartment protein n=1 Tax=Candidatus Clostridium stratigraminis TaxID=3381661 RepID=A0ABW8T8D5_9CLOT